MRLLTTIRSHIAELYEGRREASLLPNKQNVDKITSQFAAQIAATEAAD